MVIARSDSFDIELHFLAVNSVPTPGRPFVYVDPAMWSGAKFAMGAIGAQPDAGTFTVTSSVSGTTGAIAFNASASTVATALSALGGLSGATVASTTTGVWSVDSGSATASPVVTLTASAIALAPDGSTVNITKTQTANGSLHNRWQISLAKAMPVLNTSWAALAPALVTVSDVQAGSADANKTFLVVWNANAYFGGVLLSFFDGNNTFTIGPIAYNAQAQDVAAAFAATGVGNTVTVVQNALGSFTIACTGTAINGGAAGDTPTLATSSNTLVVPVGYIGTVTASTAGVDAILNGAASASTYCEVEIRQDPGLPQTVAQISNAVFIADLIPNSPGFETGMEDWATIGDVRAIAYQNFADNAARNNATPEHLAQLGFQLDTGIWYFGNALTTGSWSPDFQYQSILVGRASGVSGEIVFHNATNSFKTTISAPNALASDKTITLPNASGTIALTSDVQDNPWIVKTTTYTAVAKDAIQADTSGAAWTLTLPASATVGDFIEVQDAALTWGTNALTIARNGLKINSGTTNYTANATGGKLSLVYVSTAIGWRIS